MCKNACWCRCSVSYNDVLICNFFCIKKTKDIQYYNRSAKCVSNHVMYCLSKALKTWWYEYVPPNPKGLKTIGLEIIGRLKKFLKVSNSIYSIFSDALQMSTKSFKEEFEFYLGKWDYCYLVNLNNETSIVHFKAITRQWVLKSVPNFYCSLSTWRRVFDQISRWQSPCQT